MGYAAVAGLVSGQSPEAFPFIVVEGHAVGSISTSYLSLSRVSRQVAYALVDADCADHPIPVVVGAGQVVITFRWRNKKDRCGLAGLNDDVRAAICKQALVLDGSGFKEGGCGEFVHVFAVIFQVEPIRLPVLER